MIEKLKHPQKMVDFLLAGTQKGGTSALHYYLSKHPALCMASTKEVHFFDKDSFFSGQQVDYSIYHQFFPDTSLESSVLLGEATPIYMYWKDTPKRIFDYNPEMKFILVLRNPIERAFSHWNMEVSRSAETLDFFEAITQEKTRRKKIFPQQYRVYSYLDRGFYTEQLARLWQWFPKENIFIVRYEDLKNRPKKILSQLYSFLSIKPLTFLGKKEVFSIPYKQEITNRELRFLVNVFKDEIARLECLLGWDCSDWIIIND